MKKISFFLFTKSVGFCLNLLSFVSTRKATQLAYSLFSQPRQGKLKIKKLPKVLQKAELSIIEIENHQIQTYVWEGNETVILLIHGWESNASRWKKTIPYLQESGSTIVAIDAPAHGLSSGKEFNIPQYAAFIHAAIEKYKPRYLIGHSIGGKTILYYQSIYQNKGIEKMVVLGAPSDYKIIIQNYIHLLGLNSRIAFGLKTYYKERFKIDIDTFSSQLFASKLPLKGLIAHDIDDKIVSFEEGKKIANSWKNAVFIETKNLGHSLHDAELYKKLVLFLFE